MHVLPRVGQSNVMDDLLGLVGGPAAGRGADFGLHTLHPRARVCEGVQAGETPCSRHENNSSAGVDATALACEEHDSPQQGLPQELATNSMRCPCHTQAHRRDDDIAIVNAGMRVQMALTPAGGANEVMLMFMQIVL